MKTLTNSTVKTCLLSCLIGLTLNVFAVPKTCNEIENAIAVGVSKKTSVDTDYCVLIWNGRTNYRQRASSAVVMPIETLSHSVNFCIGFKHLS